MLLVELEIEGMTWFEFTATVQGSDKSLNQLNNDTVMFSG